MGAQFVLVALLGVFVAAVSGSDPAEWGASALPQFSAAALGKNRISDREMRQAPDPLCTFPPADYPRECNTSLIPGVSNVTASLMNNVTLTQMHLDIINTALTQFCVPKCVDPILTYYRSCSYIPSYLKPYYTQLLLQATCGKQGNEFCEVAYVRHYSRNLLFISSLFNFTGGDCTPVIQPSLSINCTTDTCSKLVADLTSKIGCCAISYLGNVSSSCGVSDSACQSVVLSSGSESAIFLAIFPMLFALLSLTFLL